jgi:hypothetical protein
MPVIHLFLAQPLIYFDIHLKPLKTGNSDDFSIPAKYT